MEKVLEKVDFLLGEKFETGDNLLHQRSFEIFSDITLSFLSDISKELLNSPVVREYPDVATFAFYCRESNLNVIKRNYFNDIDLKIGRGILFHITPGNVPVNFAYSLLAGLLTGNTNIVRVPSKKFQQVDIIINAIKAVLSSERYKSIFTNRIFLLRYNKESGATEFFSKLCDIRVIWGGNKTIDEIRKFPLLPKSSDVTFSDRYSISIIKAESYLGCHDKSKLAVDFYNDTYLFDQNACTSPRAIYWLGSPEHIDIAQKEFWYLLEQVLKEKRFKIQPLISIEKLTAFYSQAISFGNIKKEPNSNNDIWRVKNKSVYQGIDEFQCSSGYFNEVSISKLVELSNVISRRYQTVGYFGFSKIELNDWVIENKMLGIDRIVPIGRTMDFSLIWDGIDLVSAFSRKIDIV